MVSVVIIGSLIFRLRRELGIVLFGFDVGGLLEEIVVGGGLFRV